MRSNEVSRPRRVNQPSTLSGVGVLTPIGLLKSKLSTSTRTLRYYEEKGLISAIRDKRNDRLFDAENAGRATLIVVLRRLGLCLADIDAALRLDEPDRTARLAACLRRLKKEHEQAAAALGTALRVVDAHEDVAAGCKALLDAAPPGPRCDRGCS